MKNVKPGNITSFVRGFTAPFEALGFVRAHRKLVGFFIVPFIINIFLLSGLLYFSIAFLFPWLQGLVPQGDAWYFSVLRWLMTPVFMAAMALGSILLYSIIGGIIIAPFNDPLSEKVESLIGGPEFTGTFTLRGFLGDMGRVLSGMVKLLFLIVLFNLLTLLLHLIPVAGSMLYSVLGFMSGLFFLGYGFFEFPLDRRRLAFRGKLALPGGINFLPWGWGWASGYRPSFRSWVFSRLTLPP